MVRRIIVFSDSSLVVAEKIVVCWGRVVDIVRSGCGLNRPGSGAKVKGNSSNLHNEATKEELG